MAKPKGKTVFITTPKREILEVAKQNYQTEIGKRVNWEDFFIHLYEGSNKAALAQEPVTEPPAEELAPLPEVTEDPPGDDPPSGEGSQPAELAQIATQEETVVTEKATDQKTEVADCPECAKKEEELRQTIQALAEAEVRAEESNAQIVKQKETLDLEGISVQDIITHCEGGSCSGHAAQWEDIKKQIIEESWKNVPDEVLEAQGRLAPKRIIIKDVK